MRRPLLTLALLVAGLRVCATGPAAAEIDRFVQQTGSRKFREREEVSQALAAIRQPALAVLRTAAAANPDAEIRHRTARLIDTLLQHERAAAFDKLGVEPPTHAGCSECPDATTPFRRRPLLIGQHLSGSES